MKNNQNDSKNYQPQDPTKKKVCRFCGLNNYDGKYSNHLTSKHKDVMNNRKYLRNMSSHLNAEQLEEVRQFIFKLTTNK